VTIRRRPAVPSIEVSGLVATPRTLAWDQLSDLPGAIPDVALVADGFSGAAVPVAALLATVQPAPEATHGTVESGDGLYRASIPLPDLQATGWLVYGQGTAPLPRNAGGPIRLVVPQGRTLCWNVKGVVELRLTTGAEPDSVPLDPPH